MDSAVRHEGDTPAFYKRDLVLTTLVVDRQFVDMLRDDITYTVFYAGTSKWLTLRFPVQKNRKAYKSFMIIFEIMDFYLKF